MPGNASRRPPRQTGHGGRRGVQAREDQVEVSGKEEEAEADDMQGDERGRSTNPGVLGICAPRRSLEPPLQELIVDLVDGGADAVDQAEEREVEGRPVPESGDEKGHENGRRAEERTRPDRPTTCRRP